MAFVRRHPKSGRWQVRYRDPTGRERSRTFKRRVDAERFMATVSADIIRGEYVDPRLGRTTVSEFSEMWTATRLHLAQSTKDQDRHYLNSLILPAFGDRSVASIRQSEIAAWVSQLDAASATKAKALQKLAAILRLSVADGALKGNPADGVQRPSAKPTREGKAMSDSEVSRILEASERVDPNTAPMVWLMARAGLRIGEVLALKRTDVDLVQRMLHVRASMSRREGIRPVKGREGRGRTIPLSNDLAERLRTHLTRTVASIDGWLFTAPKGGRVRYNNWRARTWTRIEERASVGDINPHDLRHTLITRLFVVDGWSVPQVQAFVGHVDPTLTLRTYTHVMSDALPEPSSGHFADTLG